MHSKSLNLTWTKLLSKADAEKLTEQILTNYSLFERLQEILHARISEITKERISKSSFEAPAWSEYQAYLNGKEAALSDIVTLLKLRDKSDHD